MITSPEQNPREVDFAILGAGAIGSILGAHLARAGHSVVLLVRERRRQQIRAHGLHITGLADFSTPVPTLSDPARLRHARALIVAMKTYGTAEALAKLRHARIDVAFSIQNGTQKDELLADAFGTSHVLGALADTSGELLPNGEIVFTRNVNILIGELNGQLSARATDIARTIDAAGVRATATADIQSLEWSKFAAWVGLVALSTTTRTVTWRFLSDAGSATVLTRLVREMGLLAQALHIRLTDQAVLPSASLCAGSEDDAVRTVMAVGRRFEVEAPEHRMSSLQDIEAGRPLEINETLGYALAKADQLNLQLPLLAGLFHLIGALERLRPL